MPEYTLTEKEDRPPVDEGWYLADLVDIKEQDSMFWVDQNDHEKGKQREISYLFKILDGEFADRTVFGRTPPWFNTSPSCKFRLWVQELLGVDDLEVGLSLEIENLINLPVQIYVEQYDKKNGGVGNKVTDLKRVNNSPDAEEVF